MTPAVHPAPTEQEAAALAAALELLWPKPVAIAQSTQPPTLAWRFSGRWWQRDRMANPGRPWR